MKSSLKKMENSSKLKREENFKEDGSKEVTEVLDDGKEVKRKTFIENTEQKKLSQWLDPLYYLFYIFLILIIK